MDIMSSSETLLEIVGNILDINKIETNKMEIVESNYDFVKEVTSICKVTQTRIGEKNISNLIITCQDIGKGIKAENINKLFTKFERLDIEKI